MPHIICVIELTVKVEFWVKILVWSLKFKKVFFASLWPVVKHSFVIRCDQKHITFWFSDWWTRWTDITTRWLCWSSCQSCWYSGFWQFSGCNRLSCWAISIPWWTILASWWQIATVGTVFITDAVSQAAILCIFASFIAFIFTVISITFDNAVDSGKIAIVGAIVWLWIPVGKAIIVDWISWTPIVIIQTWATSDAVFLTWAIIDAALSCFGTIVQAKSIIITASFAIIILKFYWNFGSLLRIGNNNAVL